MSLQEPLTAAAPASDLEVGVAAPSKLSLLTRHARSIILSLSALSSLLIATLSVVLYLFLSPSSPLPSPPKQNFPFLTSGEPHPVGQPPPFPDRYTALWRLGQDLDFSRNVSVDPCDDFYQYACGGWVANQTLPPSRAIITKSFELAGLDNAQYVKEVIDADWPLVTPLFQSCMNTDALDRLGLQPAKWFLDPLSPAKATLSKEAVFGWMGQLRQKMGVTAIFDLWTTFNASNPRENLAVLDVGGLTLGINYLPYYYGPNNITARLRDGISAMFTLAGDAPADASAWATRVVDFEVSLIKMLYGVSGRLGREEGREYSEEEWGAKVLADEKAKLAESNLGLGVDELEALMPNTPIRAYLSNTRMPEVLANAGVKPDILLYYAPALYTRLDSFIQNTDALSLQLYTRWRALNESTPYLSEQVRQTHLHHFNLEGVTALPDRYPFCSEVAQYMLPDLFGRYFMAHRLSPEMRNQARDILQWLRDAFEANLPSVAWMDDNTRWLALDKANAMVELVGGPATGNWSDYSTVLMLRDRLFDNWQQLQNLRSNEEWALLAMPRSRYTWPPGTVPSMVNAFYYPYQNAMIFPVGILVPPFYNGDLPMAMNLGGIGGVMGHEMLHGFDNSGRQFDKEGVRRQWWDDNVITAFGRKTKCLINQYDNVVVQGSKVSGLYTLGENIADNGGLHMAFNVLQWYKQQLAWFGYEDPVPPSKNPLTSDQLFYWAHAQNWCTKATDQYIALQTRLDAHAPGEARVWAPLVNQAGFAKAYNCPIGSKMNPPLDRKCDLY